MYKISRYLSITFSRCANKVAGDFNQSVIKVLKLLLRLKSGNVTEVGSKQTEAQSMLLKSSLPI
jgi:hypothetical protein